jgi:hypothetical protein
MKPYTLIAVTIVTLALIAYTVGTIAQQRSRKVSGSVVGFLTVGVILDIVATVFMIIGSGKVMSLHGLLGYSALAGMLAEVVIAWRWRASRGGAPITRGMALYSRLAYAYWVIAFLSGGLLVGMSRRAAQAVALVGASVLG